MIESSTLGKVTKKILNLLIIFTLLIATFLTTMFVSYSIPNKRINWHVAESVKQLKEEGIYPKVFFDTPSAQLDNFTDSWMLNIALSADNENPIKSSLKNPHKVANGYSEGKYNKIENLEQAIANPDNTTTESYSRYWHGYLGILRPLLMFLNYTEIRFINMCVLLMLFMVVNYLLKKQLGTKIMLSFFLSMMVVMFGIVPMSLQFSSMFYVTFISMIVVLTLYKKIDKKELSIYLFFIIGSIASFIDLLTVPIITLGIPLVTYILLIQKSQEKPKFMAKRSKSIKEKTALTNLIEIIKCSIIWALGYGLTWASKWIIASIVIKENVVKDAISQILTRTSDTSGEVTLTAMDVIDKNTSLIFNDLTSKIFIMILIIWIVSMIFLSKTMKDIIKGLPLLLISVMPFVWYVVLKNHSGIHFWFTYRSLAVTIFSTLGFMVYCIDKDKIVQKLGGTGWNI